MQLEVPEGSGYREDLSCCLARTRATTTTKVNKNRFSRLKLAGTFLKMTLNLQDKMTSKESRSRSNQIEDLREYSGSTQEGFNKTNRSTITAQECSFLFTNTCHAHKILFTTRFLNIPKIQTCRPSFVGRYKILLD